MRFFPPRRAKFLLLLPLDLPCRSFRVRVESCFFELLKSSSLFVRHLFHVGRREERERRHRVGRIVSLVSSFSRILIPKKKRPLYANWNLPFSLGLSLSLSVFPFLFDCSSRQLETKRNDKMRWWMRFLVLKKSAASKFHQTHCFANGENCPASF